VVVVESRGRVGGVEVVESVVVGVVVGLGVVESVVLGGVVTDESGVAGVVLSGVAEGLGEVDGVMLGAVDALSVACIVESRIIAESAGADGLAASGIGVSVGVVLGVALTTAPSPLSAASTSRPVGVGTFISSPARRTAARVAEVMRPLRGPV
jgi:hypothetical protein